MEWKNNYRFSELIINGLVVAAINGGFHEIEDWNCHILLPSKKGCKWKKYKFDSLRDAKIHTEKRVKKVLKILNCQADK
jgi:hypothetical protein